MTTRPFRFGVVAAPREGGRAWLDTARRVADQGYATLVVPDGLQLLAPGPALVAAAIASPTLLVGTWVYAAPLRPPRATAWEAHAVSALTEGRFEMGIGAGRPDAEPFADQLGLPFGSGAERLAQVEATIAALRELDGDERHTPVLVAAGGPKARTLAARTADIVTLAIGPFTERTEVDEMVADIRDQAGDRDIELAMGVFAVGRDLPPHLARVIGADGDTLAERDSLTILPDDVEAMTDELQARRERFGISYVTVNLDYADALAPAVAALVVG